MMRYNILTMEIIDKGPIWICSGCRAMLRGDPSEQDIHEDEYFGHPESIDIGYHCPECNTWNVCRTEIHPYVLEREKRRLAREEEDRKRTARLDMEIQAMRVALTNKVKMFESIEKSAGNIV